MRLSKSLVPTLREDPADAEARSHKLMLRAGLVRQLAAALDRSYAAHEAAYRKIFERCGLRFRVVQSDTGMMGGLGAHEFMAPSAAGEDEIAICEGCDYAANVELARGVPEVPAFPGWTREEVATPNARTIAEVAAYLKVDPRLTIKSLLFVAPKAGPGLVLVRGDHNLHERKLARALA